MNPAEVDFVPIRVRLMRNPVLPYSTEIPVLGHAMRFETNSQFVMRVIQESFHPWTRLPELHVDCRSEPLLVRIVIVEGTEYEEPSDGPPPLEYFWPADPLMAFRTSGSFGVAEAIRGHALACVTPALARHVAVFRHEVVEALALAIATHVDRHPIHSSAISRDGRIIVLAGASGSGKSSVAMAAGTAGFQILTDDTTWIQMNPELAFWGWPGRVRLSRDAAAVFVDAIERPEEFARGKLAIHQPDAELIPLRSNGSFDICVIDSRRGDARLERLSPGELRHALSSQLTEGFDSYPERRAKVLDKLTARGGWRLVLSKNPLDAIPLLQQIVAKDQERASDSTEASGDDAERSASAIISAASGAT